MIMFLKCIDCGLIFDEEELQTWSERVVEWWRDYKGCPRCSSEFIEDYDPDKNDDDEEESEDEEYE